MSNKLKWLWVVVLVSSSWLAGCGTVPSSGRSAFIMLNREQEISLGEDAKGEFISGYGGEVNSPVLKQYVGEVGRRIAVATQQDPQPWDVPWEFFVVDSSVVNAFAIPGGKVFITRGLLSRLQSEGQLAGILAHECGHITSRHSAQMISRQQAITGIITLVGIIGELNESDAMRAMGVGAQLGGQLFSLSFSRENEYEADMLGIRYMSRAGYDPRAMLEVFDILKSLSGGSSEPEWLSTHPLTDNRIDEARKIIAQEVPDAASGRYTVGKEAFQERAVKPMRALPAPRHQGG